MDDSKKKSQASHDTLPEGFFRTIIENSANIAWIVERNQKRVTYINSDFSGVKKEKILEHGFSSIWPVMDIESLQLLLDAFEKAVMEGKISDNIATSHRHAVTNDEEFYLSSVVPLFNSQGKVSHVQVSSRNITPIFRARRIIDILNSVGAAMQNNLMSGNVLRIVGDKLKKHGIHAAILIKTDENTGKIAYSNFPTRKTKKANSLYGTQWADSEFSLDQWPAMKRVLKTRKAVYFDDPYKYLKSRLTDPSYKKNIGKIIELLGLKKIIVAPLIVNRETIGSFMMSSEILSRSDLAAVKTFAIQFSHALMLTKLYDDCAKLRSLVGTLLKSTGEAIFATDGDDLIVSWNKCACDLLGYEKADIIGKEVTVLGIGSDLREAVVSGSRDPDPWRMERVSLRARDGSTWVMDLTASPVEAGQGESPGVIYIINRPSQTTK